jgi:hypothetical protein
VLRVFCCFLKVDFDLVVIGIEKIRFVTIFGAVAIDHSLDLFMALIAVPQSFFLFILDLFSLEDVVGALRAEDVAAEAAMMAPSYDRQELLTAIEAVSGIAVLHPLSSRFEHLADRSCTLHPRIIVDRCYATKNLSITK